MNLHETGLQILTAISQKQPDIFTTVKILVEVFWIVALRSDMAKKDKIGGACMHRTDEKRTHTMVYPKVSGLSR